MRTLALIAAGALCLAAPAAAQEPPKAAQEPPAAAGPPGGLVFALSVAGGVEAGLESGNAGLFEGELLAGYDLSAGSSGGVIVRPEVALVAGWAPDSHAALRPGVRVSVPETPLWLRAALDWSNARGKDPRWRWVLLGVAWETRLTAAFGFVLEADTGISLSGSAGLPLILRAGATYRP